MAGCLAAAPGLAWAAPFKTGDVFLAGASVSEYTPTGKLVETLPGTAGAGVLCFDPTTGDLILPGFGVFDSSGSLLPSQWGSVAGASRCVADGRGDVYVSTCQNTSSPPCGPSHGVISKYDLEGDLLHTYSGLISSALEGLPPLYLALAPDRCTLYYGTDGSDGASINVCRDAQQSDAGGGDNDLLVLPNRDLITLTNYTAILLNPTGAQELHIYNPYPDCEGCNQLETEALDPDGTSFWIGGPPDVVRFDISTGRILAQWPGSGAIAVDPGCARRPPHRRRRACAPPSSRAR